jgi:uncharacterized membrane protein HdeD (DUF308 family)
MKLYGMKTIRYLAALLMVITGILHVLPVFKEVKDPNALPMLGFGIVYLAIGVLLFLDKKFSRILGIIFSADWIRCWFWCCRDEKLEYNTYNYVHY